MQDLVELIRHFHHWGMAALIDKMQLAVGNKLVELLAYEWRSYSIVIAPNQ
jgi:hypothetical protein